MISKDEVKEKLEELGASYLGEHVESGKKETCNLIKIFEENGIGEGAKILDLGCGVGRHDVPLTKMGYDVTAIDMGGELIEKARRYAEDEDVSDNVNFLVRDMRNVNDFEESFDAIICLFGGFGFNTNEENEDIIRKSVKLLNNDGIFILDVPHRDSLLANKYHPYDNNYSEIWKSEENSIFEPVDKRLNFMDGREYTKKKTFEVDDDYELLKEGEYSQRIYTTHELRKIFENSGCELKEVYNNLKREKLSLDGVRQVLVFKKKK